MKKMLDTARDMSNTTTRAPWFMSVQLFTSSRDRGDVSIHLFPAVRKLEVSELALAVSILTLKL